MWRQSTYVKSQALEAIDVEAFKIMMPFGDDDYLFLKENLENLGTLERLYAS
jgi:hypothetical protein